MAGCKKEVPGIVNVCIAPTVIRTTPANGGTNEPLNKTNVVTGSTAVAAVKVITATFSTPMDPSDDYHGNVYRAAGRHLTFRNGGVL